MECRGRSRQFISGTNFISAKEQTILMLRTPPISGSASSRSASSSHVDLESLLFTFFLLPLLAILFVPRKKLSLRLSLGNPVQALAHCLLTFSDRWNAVCVLFESVSWE